ncbi:MAG: replicative DNA helicase [Marinomonas gallaica]
MNNIPPHSIEAEQGVLGAIMLDDKKMDIVAEMVEADHFYMAVHADIYAAMRMLYKSNKPIDMITISDLLEKTHEGEGITIAGSIMRNCPSSASVKTYCEIVREKWKGRKLLEAAHTLCEKVYGGEDYDSAREETYRGLDLANTAQVDDCISDGDELTGIMIDEMERIVNLGGAMPGLSTGDMHIDQVTGGFSRGDYVTLAARSGGGKTTKALDIVKHFTLEGRRSLVFSMEMKKKKFMQKICSNIGNVEYDKIKRGDMDDVETYRIGQALKDIKESHLHVDDTGGLYIADIERKARRLKAKYGNLDLIVVDYVQRLKHDSSNKYAELSEASNRLKDLFMELDCVGIVLAQLKKNSMGLPNASDLRETGSIENDSDTIIFLHTDSDDRKPKRGMLTAEIFNKVRDGETCIKMLKNELQFQRFESVEGEYEEPQENVKRFSSKHSSDQ